jgi:hypothetical protein
MVACKYISLVKVQLYSICLQKSCMTKMHQDSLAKACATKVDKK